MCQLEQKISESPAPSFTPIRSVSEAIAPVESLALSSPSVIAKPIPFAKEGREYFIPRYLFIGPKGGTEPIRVGLFAGVYGDEPEGTFALLKFIEALEQNPSIAQNFCLFLYPISNPSGFEFNLRRTIDGVDIPAELWKNSLSPEVQILQTELWIHAFDGIIYLNTDPSATELRLSVAGPAFARHLFNDALSHSQDLLPQSVDTSRSALPPIRRTRLNEPGELIRAAPGLKRRPFEIVITIPGQSPAYLQTCAINLLLRSALSEYQKFISFAANL